MGGRASVLLGDSAVQSARMMPAVGKMTVKAGNLKMKEHMDPEPERRMTEESAV